MPRKKANYREGDWFAVPLKPDGYCVGLIARVSRRSGILLGYFFGPKQQPLPRFNTQPAMASSDALFIGKFSDLGILEDGWPIVYSDNEWGRNRADWPLPLFVRIDLIDGTPHLDEYDDSLKWVRETPSTMENVSGLPANGMSGHIALQIKLTHLLTNTLG